MAIATLTGENGILTQVGKAKTEMEKQGALEKVKIAIMGSYEANGTVSVYGQNSSSIKLDYAKLKDNLEAIDGFEEMSENGEIKETSFPITVKVDGQNIIIELDGTATFLNVSQPPTSDNVLQPPTNYDYKYDLSPNEDESILAYVYEGVIAIFGSGDIKDNSEALSSIYSDPHKTPISTVVVNEGITHIGSYLFNGEAVLNVTTITLPSTLKSIGQGAFYVCGNLSTVKFNGTKVQWNSISIDNTMGHNTWLTRNTTIVCTDGNITL